MLQNASVPLRAVAGSSKLSLRRGFEPCLLQQIRYASKGRSPIAVGRQKRKPKEEPVRDKVAGSFLPLPQKQGSLFVTGPSGIEDLPTLTKGAYPKDAQGKILQFPTTEGNLLKTFGVPRNMLIDFRLLTVPCSVSRRCTEDLARRLEIIGKESGTANRLVLTGSAGCGKSYLLLQMAFHCALNDWIVLYIPRAHTMIDSSTAYIYDPRTQSYLQPDYSNQLLQRMLMVNRRKFDNLKLTEEIVLEKLRPLPIGTSLKDVVKVADMDHQHAPTILSAVLKELGKQDRHPVLIAVDELQALYNKTNYKNQHFELIKSYHLSVPRLIMEYASGMKTLDKGAFVGALSSGLTQYPLPPELQAVVQKDKPVDPYTKLIPDMLAYAQGLEAYPVPERMDPDEAAGVFEIWMKDRALHSAANDELFLTKYSEAAGNVRDFVHGGLFATQMS